jgi:hypothetical protein
MVALVNSIEIPCTEALKENFLALLPKIENYARFHFRVVKCAVRKADCIAETVAFCWQWFLRLAERGKDAADFISTLALLAARSVKVGRRLCGQERVKDVMSSRAQRRHRFTVESLPISTRTAQEDLYGTPGGQRQLDEYEERLQDNTITPPPDQAAFRIDWPRFLGTLTHRDRQLARFLSLGHRPSQAAKRFGLTPGRVTQLRQQWSREWRSFGGEDYFERRRHSCPGKKARVMA